MIYLASPYTHEDKAIEKRRYVQVCRAAGSLIKQGQHIYSPIAHSRAIAEQSDLPHDYEFWAAYDTDMIHRCDEVVVLMLDGWEQSAGVQAEIKIARVLNKPLRYINFMEDPTKRVVQALDQG